MSRILDQAKIGDLVSQARIDANISQRVNSSFTKFSNGSSLKDYYFVTDLVNPIFYFWEKKNHIKAPDHIQEKLEFGSYIHRISRYWLEKLDRFIYSEASVVGDYVGLDRISGKIDYQIGDSIVELKTKEEPVRNVDEVLDVYPQDLEQLMTYVAISSSVGPRHKIVFINGSKSNNLDFKSFVVTINNLEGVRSQIIKRRNLLDDALEKDDQFKLPKCRYFDSGCKFKEANICNCDKLHRLDAREFLKYVDIQEDPKLSAKLKNAYDNYTTSYVVKEGFELWDLILPMKKYHRHYDYAQDEDDETGQNFATSAIKFTISNAIFKSGIRVEDKALDALRKAHQFGFTRDYQFVKIHVPSISKYPIPVPYTIKVSQRSSVVSEKRLSNFYYAQAVLMAVDSGSRCAVLFVGFPQASNQIVAYVLCADSDKVAREVRSAHGRLSEAIRNGDQSNLDKCPNWMIKDCPYDSCYCKL